MLKFMASCSGLQRCTNRGCRRDAGRTLRYVRRLGLMAFGLVIQLYGQAAYLRNLA